MTETQLSRFKDAPWFPKKEVSCIVGGAGGIGSWLTLLLARAGFKPIVYDYDIIEEHNIGGQLYTTKAVKENQYKIDCLDSIVKDFSDTSITTFNDKYTETSMGHKYMFSAFDNMKARKDMFNVWKQLIKDTIEYNGVAAIDTPNNLTGIFIDGRLNAEQLQIFCVTFDTMDKYEKYLFSDEEVPDTPCTFKQTSHVAAIIAGLMTSFFTNYLTNVVSNSDDRKVPFMFEYFIPINYINEIE
jgi:molybdopterin/thiamine biosynthesis adenylyltransferase